MGVKASYGIGVKVRRAGIFKKSMGAWNRIGIALSFPPGYIGWRNSFL
jgi:hypothetical protein